MKTKELFPYIRVTNANEAIDFYQKVFEARELFRLTEPSGRVGHAELDLGGPVLMLSEEFPEFGLLAPRDGDDSCVTLHVHVDNADAAIQRALDAGATLEMAAQDHFYGERSGNIRDPFGYRWSIGHHLESVSPEEMQRRYTELCNA